MAKDSGLVRMYAVRLTAQGSNFPGVALKMQNPLGPSPQTPEK